MNLSIKHGILLAALGLSAPVQADFIVNGDFVYDTTTNLTWLRNANYANSQMFNSEAVNYVNNLIVDGIGGWRLPSMTLNNYYTGYGSNSSSTYDGTGDIGYNVNRADSEIANIYAELGNQSAVDTNEKERSQYVNASGIMNSLSNSNPFFNLEQPFLDSLGRTEYTHSMFWENITGLGTIGAFEMSYGIQNVQWISNPSIGVWAVQTGDVSNALLTTVPVPAAVWLFGSALAGFVGFTRRKPMQQTA